MAVSSYDRWYLAGHSLGGAATTHGLGDTASRKGNGEAAVSHEEQWERTVEMVRNNLRSSE